MREIDLNEVKEIQIAILDKVHEFCIKNDITYFLSCGSLLGAVRHGGYIPWDDDIDLFMPRDCYERFINIYNGEENGTRLRTIFTDNQYYYPFAKVEDVNTILVEKLPEKMEIGVNIDIFPVDGVPDNSFLKKVYFAKIKMIRNLPKLKLASLNKKRTFLKQFAIKCFKYILRNRTLRDFAKCLDSSIDKANNTSSYVCNITASRSCFMRESIMGTVEVTFEGKRYRTMIGYDDYLTMTYGRNYMQLPPKEKQVSHHVFQAFYK